MTKTNAETLKSLGGTVRLKRAQLDLSQEAAGQRGGLHRNYIGAIERGEINPTYTTLRRLANALGTPLDKLIRDAERREASVRAGGADGARGEDDQRHRDGIAEAGEKVGLDAV